MWTRKLSATVIVKGSHPWVWRLRPLGHPDSGLWISPLPFCSQTCKWRIILDVCAGISNRDSGVMVSIVAFQAVDRGSIPRCRNCLFVFFNSRWQFRGYEKKHVRSGIRTHAHICGPECSWPLYWPKDLILESGALDHSAILTMVSRECKRDCSRNDSIWNKNMLQVRFELTTSASLAPRTAYKYGALTDCATGATITSLIIVCLYTLTWSMIKQKI